MKNNPTAEKRFYKKLTKLIETGAVKFDSEPREVIDWFEKMWQQYTQQNPVTDISVNYLVKILKRTLKGNSEVRVEFETEADNINYILDVCNNFKMELEKDRDLQPKTDDWIECSERLPSKDTVESIAELRYKTIHKIGLWAEYKGYVTYWKEKSSLPQPPNPKNR